MTRVDFYQLSRDPVERVTAMLARKVLGSGARLLVVSDDAEQRAALSRELWRGGPEEFLANGDASRGGAERQPVLISAEAKAENGASMVIFADGKWRAEGQSFERALLLFGPEQTEAARGLWRELDGSDDIVREIHKQDDSGRWRAGG